MLVKSSILQRNRRIFNVLRNFIRRNNAPLYASVQVVKEHFAGAVVYFGGFAHSTLAKRRKVGDAKCGNPKDNKNANISPYHLRCLYFLYNINKLKDFL